MMLRTFCVFVLNVVIIKSSVGQIIQNGQCNPSLALQAEFDLDSFEGQWFEIGRSDQRGPDCSNYQFQLTDDDIQVRYQTVNENFFQEQNGTALFENGTARFAISFPPTQPYDFWILRTDYINFAIAYNCENISPTQRSVNVWTMGRQTSFPTTIMVSLINNTLNNALGIIVSNLREVTHSDQACFNLPAIPPGDAVILAGQCDDNIQVVQNFSAANFLGVWHEIASYASENSLNQCSRAEYTALPEGVLVENSQVINQTLFTINGLATVISTDGSARLSVVLNVNGNDTEPQELLILATDYVSYAVSYSCVNLPNNQRRIYSWILGRSRRLNNETQAAVDQVVDRELVLNYQYFTPTNQSDEACFFFPEYVPGRPVVFRGLCDLSIPVVSNFQPANYTGIWHDIESYHAVFQNGTCRNANYQLGDGIVDVLNTQVINGALDSIVGEAVLASTDGSGRLNVTFPLLGTNVTVTTNYWILGTDYTSYSLVYSCTNLDENERQVWAWKLSRTKELTPQASTAIVNIMNGIPVLDQQYFESVNQTRDGCFYVPDPVPGVPVVFPGLCQQNVSVVSNFNFTLFEGIWYEIEAYPKEQQQGQCINHQYSTGSGVTLNLQSSQVIDQFLRIFNGTLASAQNDGSGRLTININVDGEAISFPFWILDTDYTDYALVYSCIQLNDDFRGIYSWKLSRTRQLSMNAQTNIANAIAPVEVLDDIFYESIDQSDEACFFLPELAPGEPIILVGQCDPNITAISNFQVANYTGEWRLVESYPTEFQSGTCNRANYSPGANGSIIVLNSQVIDQTLDTIEGSAVLASADGSGRLLVTFHNASTPIEYLILATDYSSYSLIYSCQNINSEQRRVWSWKMSRTNTLSATATTAINAVVNSINVLNNQYYYAVNNTDEACFYFPDPVQGAPVIFRGSCDQTISAVPNFNVTRYLGTWHNIELYPSRFQEGTCSNANYNLFQGSVTVVNTQVVDQTLDSITGSAIIGSVDNSGRLNVTFPVADTNDTVTLSLWVLDTDYDSYSLVYSCEDRDEHRQVWSWKLSKRKELSTDAITRINSTMSTIQVLDNRYFWPVDQSEEGCFYYPDAQPGVAVEFPGRCEDNIPVVQNFNMTQFQGIWYEVSAFPIGEDLGDCASHNYSLGVGNTLDLQYETVNQLSLNLVNGTLGFVSNNTDGRLIISVRILNSVVEIPFWILNVAYDDYALAYGCVDLDSVLPDVNYRRIYSWKLSKTSELSASAVQAIDATISSVNVLREEYYEDVDQSDDACFYVPEVIPGEVIVFPGQCEHTNVSVVQNFDASAYLGRWYLIESYPSDFQSGSCNDANYTLGANGTVDVFNTQVINETLDTIVGSAVAYPDGTGRLLVTFPGATEPSEYWILATDYTSYALVYSCVNINTDQRTVWSWKLSRTQNLSAAANNSINEVVNSINVLNDRFYETIDHSPEGCFYFPEPNASVPIRFRGRCDQNISVVQNFNATSYLGLWHLIESYPSSFQDGTCNNALYQLGSLGVDVLNSQVVNQSLDTMAGLAVVASTDGSAILDVSFPIADTNETITTPYWVLATDYNSYSLVYTCVEDGDEYVNVWSWKMSRTKQLTQVALNAINTVVNSVQVLDDRYYQDIDQSREGCFYYPDPQPGVPVVFSGQCENITVVQNFNLTWFGGIWHEIEAYPNYQQQGQCINHNYSSFDSDLQTSYVANQTLNIANGSLTFSSGDGSARMTLTVNLNGTVASIPFWIVDTDYEDYALAYSCSNLNQDFRQVYSWKLSRRRTLSPGAVTAISAAMSSINVINDDYFEPVDQTDPACFHLPDLAPGEPVVLPGQCDMNIPVVENFNLERYLNRWRLIETYSSEFQNGTCIEGTYTRATDGTVDVFNTQVVDQTLLTMRGTAVVASADGRGILQVTFPGTPGSTVYWILDTDYDSYSLVYSCANLNNDQRRVWAWKLSRDRTLSPNATSSIDAVVQNIDVLDQRYFQTVQQSDDACFYYPEADGRPVTFRGQCDQSIAVVTNFDAALYTGVWYDIESFPQNLQEGTCPTAEYTLNGGVVSVVNTEVRAQELHVIEATAVLAGNASEAKLVVTFPIAGTNLTVQVPYWVLATDYNNYSLVYSCDDIDDEYRRVTSWKLSRSQNLTTASSNAITAAMNQVPVLRQQYFVPRGHSEDDCFFYPDNFGGPVLLEGQCAPPDQVNVVTNFDATRFSGPWREASRFPSNVQSGQCAVNQYLHNQAANSLDIQLTIVEDEALTTVTGTATIGAGGRGVLTLNTTNNELNTMGNLYVLDVDYDDFALLYGCSNINSSYIQVYSWKLTRSRTGLSQAANERIDAIVSAEPNLFERYYDETAQDNAACFYYPDFGTELPEAITLPGPCDSTIRGVPNFDAELYFGRWLEIEKYPQPSQAGQCNRAQYTNAGNVVDVFNTQVVNRTLLTQRGIAVPASNDGFGELTVTFNIDGVDNVANYYILATDYSNFALVYSCRNLDNGDRQVASWKLSRTNTLSAAATNQINAAIATTEGLLQDYYTITDQSQGACFYIPEVNPSQEVRLRGSCANVTGQANFDLQRYLGWWHEINSYPTGPDGGVCMSSQYRQRNNVVEFVDTRVTGLDGHVTRGTVVATSDGRLTRTWADGQQDILWVLATDYTGFALIFSCEEIDDEYIRVWSSMQSQTRSLPSSAVEAFAPLLAENEYLIQDFFLPVAQTDAACFHYPEQAGQQVILPGQCNQNIPVQAQFNIVQFTGIWYQTERYPYPQIADDSTCIGVRVSYDENSGVVSLLNWEVRDDQLLTIDSLATVSENSATLQIVTPVPGSENVTTTADLHILTTDYASYTLAYTCENLNPFERVVVAFKLSRTRTLPAAASTAINSYMANHQELHQPLFIPVVQQEDCDEPDSSYLVKSSVALIVLCYTLLVTL